MTRFLNKFKKNPVFGPNFGPLSQFYGLKFFSPKNLALSQGTSSGSLALCQILGKTNDAIPRKHPDRQKDKWKE